jgi:transposase
MIDARSFSHDALEYIRIQSVKAVEGGLKITQVAKIFGVHRGSVSRWLKIYRTDGVDGLKQKPMPGKKQKLEKIQQEKLRVGVCCALPMHFGYLSTRWTTGIIQDLIKKNFSVNLHPSSVSRLLKRLDITVQRPERQSEGQDMEDVKRWMQEEFPIIKELAKQEGSVLYFLDEAGTCVDYHARASWSLKGLTPVIPMPRKYRDRVNMISSINSEGDLHYEVGTWSFNANKFIEYLKKLSEYANKPIWIVTDRHPVHVSKAVKKYTATTEGRIKLSFLPKYSPALNPVELIWGNVKSHKLIRYLIRNKQVLAEKASDLLESLKQSPDKIRAFFRKESVCYAI